VFWFKPAICEKSGSIGQKQISANLFGLKTDLLWIILNLFRLTLFDSEQGNL